MLNFISWSRPVASVNYISFALMMKLSSEHMSEESLDCWQIADPPDYNINISKDRFELTWDCRVWYLRIESIITSTLCPHPSILCQLAGWEFLESVPTWTDHPSLPGRTRSLWREIYSLNQRACGEHANWTFLLLANCTCVWLLCFSFSANSRSFGQKDWKSPQFCKDCFSHQRPFPSHCRDISWL